MRTIIAGSRSATVDNVLDALDECPFTDDITVVISGACPNGADRWGEAWAKSEALPLELHPADWDENRIAAGPIRNGEMAEVADALIAVWDFRSKGTRDMLMKARGKGLKIHLHRFKPRR